MASAQIQYLGFQLTPRGRAYLYRVVDAKAENREFMFRISNQSFAEKQFQYQDAADLCFQQLRRELDLETPENPIPRNQTPTDQEFREYLQKHRPPKRRTW